MSLKGNGELCALVSLSYSLFKKFLFMFPDFCIYQAFFLDVFAETQGNKTQDFSKTQRKFSPKLKVPEEFP